MIQDFVTSDYTAANQKSSMHKFIKNKTQKIQCVYFGLIWFFSNGVDLKKVFYTRTSVQKIPI